MYNCCADCKVCQKLTCQPEPRGACTALQNMAPVHAILLCGPDTQAGGGASKALACPLYAGLLLLPDK